MSKNITHTPLTRVVLEIPQGSIVTNDWLAIHGISSKLAWYYVKSKWLKKVGEKVYKRPNDIIGWTGLVNTVQAQLGLPVHVSGKSALALNGHLQYLQMSDSALVDLTVETKIHIPKWVKDNNLSKDKLIINGNMVLNSKDYKDFLIHQEVNGFDVVISCNELAIMEVLQLTPTQQDFTEAAQLMEGLAYMRASKVQLVLEKCNSIKAKRLYLYLGTKFNHDWIKKIDMSKIYLGSGKRMLTKGGTYDSEFQITVPEIQEQ
ncbi:MAG TPA: type IV toxin-antitoxin system AbiEi family antitoxin domain-containing protein [Aquella sp.]|nr:type IV toxin-antitoxin system AbiEi family antitoxin domain-containing protein [Aquella sp.]